jgi:hypothetical protein
MQNVSVNSENEMMMNLQVYLLCSVLIYLFIFMHKGISVLYLHSKKSRRYGTGFCALSFCKLFCATNM